MMTTTNSKLAAHVARERWRQKENFSVFVLVACFIKKRRVGIAYIVHVSQYIGYAAVQEDYITFFSQRTVVLLFTAFKRCIF